MWDRDGTPRALPPLAGDEDSVTTDINNYGQAAGYSVNVASFVDNEFTAVAWDRNGAVTALLPLPGHTQSRAEGITTRGGFTVAGTSFGDGARGGLGSERRWNTKGAGFAIG